MNRIFIFVGIEWFIKYLGDVLELMYDCYIAEMPKGFRAVELLGSKAYVMKVRKIGSVQTRYCYIINHQIGKCRISKRRSSNNKFY